MLAKKTIKTTGIMQSWNAPIKTKVKLEHHLGVEAFNKTRILIRLKDKDGHYSGSHEPVSDLDG